MMTFPSDAFVQLCNSIGVFEKSVYARAYREVFGNRIQIAQVHSAPSAPPGCGSFLSSSRAGHSRRDGWVGSRAEKL
jgi:hypothetical protein